ncbi:MAG: dihydrofolate reductase [Patescibacteria group bacterium UBA2103]
MSSIKIIAAIGTERLLGIKKADGTFHLPWSIPEDMKHFTHMTTGGTVIMGRTTWESIPEKYRPLPDRVNIVLTTTPGYKVPEGVHIYTNMVSALENARKIGRPIWIIGGAQVYEQTLSVAEELILTRVPEELLRPPMEGEERILFPEFEDRFTRTEHTPYEPSKNDNIPFRFETWKRK